MPTIRVMPLALLALLAMPMPVFSDSRTLVPQTAPDSAAAGGATDCGDGVVKDDGTIESGYGWVPSVIDGRYVQRFEYDEFRSRKIEQVCVCWTRTQADDEVHFRVELYRDRGGYPSSFPEASVEAVATQVPAFPEGSFYTIDVSEADMHAATNTFYIGVQWNPSVDEFFFVCVDQTDTTPVVDGWFIDDRADAWASVLLSSDPIFDDHRAMMIRARAVEGFFPLVPTLGGIGITVMVVALAGAAALLLRRRR